MKFNKEKFKNFRVFLLKAIKKLLLFLVLFSSTAAIAFLGLYLYFPKVDYPEEEKTENIEFLTFPTSKDIKGKYPGELTVLRVIDGDTFIADIHMGLGVSAIKKRIRVSNYDAVELKEDKGVEARDFLYASIKSGIPILISEDNADVYGRILGEVILIKDGQIIKIKDLMQEQGYIK